MVHRLVDPYPVGKNSVSAKQPSIIPTFHILRTPCRKKLKTYILPKFGLLNQNLLVKRDEWDRKSCCFDIFVRFTNYKNCQNWSITNAIFEMRHSEVPKITIFWKRIGLSNFSRNFIFFVYLCLYIHSLPLTKNDPSKSKSLWLCWCSKLVSTIFLSNFYSPNDSPSKTIKKIFYFI